jgi:PadR family transcriptional regulator, regulatory protein PadR
MIAPDESPGFRILKNLAVYFSGPLKHNKQLGKSLTPSEKRSIHRLYTSVLQLVRPGENDNFVFTDKQMTMPYRAREWRTNMPNEKTGFNNDDWSVVKEFKEKWRSEDLQSAHAVTERVLELVKKLTHSVGRSELADEISQEVLLKLMLVQNRDVPNLHAYITAACRNSIADRIKRAHRTAFASSIREHELSDSVMVDRSSRVVQEAKVRPVSNTEASILQIMAENGYGERYGLELMRLSNGRLKRGTIYTTLQRMEDKGFIASRQEDKPDDVSGIPRRLYEITGVGQRALDSYQLRTLNEDILMI